MGKKVALPAGVRYKKPLFLKNNLFLKKKSSFYNECLKILQFDFFGKLSIPVPIPIPIPIRIPIRALQNGPGPGPAVPLPEPKFQAGPGSFFYQKLDYAF